MRNRTPDSTTPLDTAKSWVYSITEKGLRASGATSIMEAVASIRQTMDELEKAATQLKRKVPKPSNGRGTKKPLSLRHATIYARYHQDSKKRVPDLRLSGLWLGNAGFEIGQKYQVRVDKGQLIICAE